MNDLTMFLSCLLWISEGCYAWFFVSEVCFSFSLNKNRLFGTIITSLATIVSKFTPKISFFFRGNLYYAEPGKIVIHLTCL